MAVRWTQFANTLLKYLLRIELNTEQIITMIPNYDLEKSALDGYTQQDKCLKIVV